VWRLFVNGEQLDEWNRDKLLQAYACSLLDYYHPYFKRNKQSYFPSNPINLATDETTAFFNGFCIWFSAALKGTSSARGATSVQVGDTVYDLCQRGSLNADAGIDNLKGIDNEAAIASALYKLNIPQAILKAALTPKNTGTASGAILGLAQELSHAGYDVEGVFREYGLLPAITRITTNIPSPRFCIYSENTTDGELTIARDIEFKEQIGSTTYMRLNKGENEITLAANLTDGEYYYQLSTKGFKSKPYRLGIKITGTNSTHVRDSEGKQISTTSGNISLNMPKNAVGEDYELSINEVEKDVSGLENADSQLPQGLERVKGLTADFIITTAAVVKNVNFASAAAPVITMKAGCNPLENGDVLIGTKGNSVPLSTLQVYCLASDMSRWQLS
ncbi:MAG: hypothetical protein AAB296_05710, partial [Candidatus Desantisbacteria bacterium]